jgi:hypothetical protein
MPSLDRWDTGYRSPDWNERPDWGRRLDYHDHGIDYAASQLLDDIWETCQQLDDPDHHCDHVRNLLALLIRQVGSAFNMSPAVMRSFAYGLGDQAYREECIRLFHGDVRAAEAYRDHR